VKPGYRSSGRCTVAQVAPLPEHLATLRQWGHSVASVCGRIRMRRAPRGRLLCTSGACNLYRAWAALVGERLVDAQRFHQTVASIGCIQPRPVQPIVL
jgi:hypothetical protein